MGRLNGKVAVVAGGATARRLAAEGAAVVIGDLETGNAEAIAREIAASGGQALGIGLDISEEPSVAGLVEAAVSRFGVLDLMHANAVDVDLAVLDRTIAVSLRGHLLCTRLAIPQMLRCGGGAIVYTSSSAAFIGEPERPCYAMAKAGANAPMRHVASRWGRQGIRANAVAPGLVLTENNLRTMPEEVKKRALAHGRSTPLGTPDDIAATVVHLPSDDGAWINGQVISMDGGSTLR